MKWIPCLLIASLSLIPTPSPAAETAQARIYCLSLRFQQGQNSFGDTLDLGTLAGAPNGELAPTFSGRTYYSGFVLDYSGFPIDGTIYVNLPTFTDANGNGFDDFFEVSQAANAVTTGLYYTAIGGGTVTATWSRGAGSKDGTCVLDLVDNTYGDLGDFVHVFELIEYTGPLSFTPGATNVNGSVSLTQTGNAANQMHGPVQFVKVYTNRFNQLNLQPGGWTNAALQTLTFTNHVFLRDPIWPTNYYGYVEFDDGDPTTSDPDYWLWLLSIDDLNDANHNGIPDFSDDPQGSLPRRPLLSLAQTSTNVLLTIHGDVGHVHQVQESLTLTTPRTNWPTVLTVTLTNDPQVVSLPLPAGAVKFWSVQAQ